MGPASDWVSRGNERREHVSPELYSIAPSSQLPEEEKLECFYHYYYLRDQAKTGENSGNAALYYFEGQDPGAFVSISGGGVLASSKHQADAQAFLKWVTGHAGQAILRDGDAYLDAPKVDVSKLNGKKVAEVMTQAGLL
jgi:iron(III) transport system substrate-binding protein